MLLPKKLWNNKTSKKSFIKKMFSKVSTLTNKNIKINNTKQIKDKDNKQNKFKQNMI